MSSGRDVEVTCKNRYEKVLGIEWDDINDKLIFNVNEIFKDAINIQPTKRNILSIISTIYDPVGYLQPITIPLKILFQEICKLKVDWDEIIEVIVPKWKGICKYLKSIQDEFNRKNDVNTNSLRPKRNAAIIGELKRKFNS